MLKLEYLFENFELANAALAFYPHDAERTQEALRFFRISSNAVYPFWTEEGLCFLRLCPAAEKSFSEIAAEMEWILWLRERGYPAMQPVLTLDGECCRTIDTPWGAYCMSAFRAVAGKPVEEFAFTEEMIDAYGKALGRLHRLSAEFEPSARRPDYETVAADMRSMLPQSLHAVLDAVLKKLAAIPRTGENFGLVHYDFEPDNVFFEEETQTISVIDFDDSLYHFYALDVQQALECLAELAPQGEAEKYRAVFLHGYRSEYPLSAEMEGVFPLMRGFIDLRACARLHHCLQSEPPMRPEWLTELEGRLRDKCRWLEQRLQNGEY